MAGAVGSLRFQCTRHWNDCGEAGRSEYRLCWNIARSAWPVFGLLQRYSDLIPGAAKWGLYKSTDGGQTWTFIHNGSADASVCTGDVHEFLDLDPCSPFGVRRVLLDPSNPDMVYAGSFARGVWRSTDAGLTWVQIKPSLDSANSAMRPEMSVTTSSNGKTRMYVAEGATGPSQSAPNEFSQLFRSDDTTTASPTFMALTSPNPGRLRIWLVQLL